MRLNKYQRNALRGAFDSLVSSRQAALAGEYLDHNWVAHDKAIDELYRAFSLFGDLKLPTEKPLDAKSKVRQLHMSCTND